MLRRADSVAVRLESVGLDNDNDHDNDSGNDEGGAKKFQGWAQLKPAKAVPMLPSRRLPTAVRYSRRIETEEDRAPQSEAATFNQPEERENAAHHAYLAHGHSRQSLRSRSRKTSR